MRYLVLLLMALPCWGQIQELVNAYPLRTTMLEWRTKINANFSYLDAKAAGITGYESTPTGSCSNYATGIVAAGTIYTCQNGTWGALTFSQVYPGAGVAVSSGSAWGSSLTLDTDGTLAANSDTRIASQKATKTYVDTGLGAKAGFPGSGVANSTGAAWGSSYSFSTSATLTENSDTYIASQKAVKSYVDTGLSGKAASNASTAVNGQTCALGGTCAVPGMVGDSGSGGTAGLVPAPAAGDGAAGKFLKADGTWSIGNAGPAGPAGPVGPPGPSGIDGAPGVPGYSPNSLMSGGGVAWISGLNFTVSAATYIIGNVQYSSAQTDITLDSADPSNDRIDVVAVNSSGQAVVIKGTASATPAQPDVDPASQLQLTWVYVATGATTPSNTVLTDIYHENTEWTSAKSGTPINLASTSNPHTGSVDIEGTNVAVGNYFQFAAAAPFDPVSRKNTVFYIRSKGSWGACSIQFSWYLSNTRKGSVVVLSNGAFGFNSATTGTYQQIVIPNDLFAVNGVSVDRLRGTVAGTCSSVGWYIDDITLQGGVISGGAASGMTWKGTWNAATSYAANDVATVAGVPYVALAASVNSTPPSANWSAITSPVASGTAALGTSEISSGACASVVTVSATGVATTDVIQSTFNADPTGVVGYAPNTSGMLTIIPYPTANNVNFKVCNNTAGAITPGAITLNWRVAR